MSDHRDSHDHPGPFDGRADRWHPYPDALEIGDGTVMVRTRCLSSYQGGPSVAHGGWTAAAMDDLLGACANSVRPMAVTGLLSVRYVRPVPVERELILTARIERGEGRRRIVSGEMRLASGGALLATATGTFVERDEDHFARHEAWLAQQEP